MTDAEQAVCEFLDPLRSIDPPTRRSAPAPRERRRTGWVLEFVALAIVVFAVVGGIAWLAHHQTAEHQPSGPGQSSPTFPPPPACASVASGSGVDCGPAQAAIRTAGSWQVIDQGRCVDHTRLYFGLHTSNGDAPLSLMLDVPPRALAGGGDAQVTGGWVALTLGARESVVGEAVIAPGATTGAFSVHSRDGKRYVGAWTCHPSYPVTQVAQGKLPACQSDGFHNKDGYRLVCGPGSAIVWVGGRWQIAHPEICMSMSRVSAAAPYYSLNFGIVDGHYPAGNDPHRTLWTHFHVPHDDGPHLLSHGGVVDVIDGEIDLPGAHSALWGRAIVQQGARGGAFDLNNRGGVPGSQGGAGAGSVRVDYPGAWTCG